MRTNNAQVVSNQLPALGVLPNTHHLKPKTDSKQVVPNDRDKKIGPAHAGNGEPSQSDNRPESHFDFAFVFFSSLQCEIDTKNAYSQSDGGEDAKYDEEEIIGHNSKINYRLFWRIYFEVFTNLLYKLVKDFAMSWYR